MDEKAPLRIVGLKAENFQKLKVVEVEAGDGPLVTVGGQNEAGKSSLIDAIASVIGGVKLAPKVPIRQGQKSAQVTATVGDLKIVRKFRLDDETDDVTSTLEITSADGSASFKSPQAMLDKLLGSAPFYDPLAFAQLRPADRREAVRAVVGLDFSVQDARRRKLLDDKLGLQRRLESAERAIEGVAPYKDLPAEEIDPADLLRDIERAESTHEAANKASHTHAIYRGELEDLHESILAADADVETARQALRTAETKAADLRAQVPAKSRQVDEALENLKHANDARVDPAPLKLRMQDVKDTNKKIQFNRQLEETAAAVDALRLELKTTTDTIAIVDAEKQKALAAAPFPVPGMAFSDDDVLLGGLPFSQASTAQKIRASVAMALARAGQLRVLLVKAGNDLDKKSLALLAEIAKEHQAQVWVERVAEAPGEVTVFLEDGEAVRA